MCYELILCIAFISDQIPNIPICYIVSQYVKRIRFNNMERFDAFSSLHYIIMLFIYIYDYVKLETYCVSSQCYAYLH